MDCRELSGRGSDAYTVADTDALFDSEALDPDQDAGRIHANAHAFPHANAGAGRFYQQ
jgi:hypothetical protein